MRHVRELVSEFVPSCLDSEGTFVRSPMTSRSMALLRSWVNVGDFIAMTAEEKKCICGAPRRNIKLHLVLPHLRRIPTYHRHQGASVMRLQIRDSQAKILGVERDKALNANHQHGPGKQFERLKHCRPILIWFLPT
jgi:hypothetical protein